MEKLTGQHSIISFAVPSDIVEKVDTARKVMQELFPFGGYLSRSEFCRRAILAMALNTLEMHADYIDRRNIAQKLRKDFNGQ